VTVGGDNTIRVKCFACGLCGDIFNLIAAVERLDIRHDFPRVLNAAARLANYDLKDEQRHPGPRPMAPEPAAERPYPPAGELRALWESGSPIASDPQASDYYRARGLDVERLDALDLVRVIGRDLPIWAAYGGRSWQRTGHRTIVPVYDHQGRLRSVRAVRVTYGGDIPKRLPPAGYRAAGLIMATSGAQDLLAGSVKHAKLLICEGEPDYLTWASEPGQVLPLFGIVSGSWTGNMSARIADGTEVLLLTHNDNAGDAYAKEINLTIGHRCKVLRAKVPQ
jgi:hypothetical protein